MDNPTLYEVLWSKGLEPTLIEFFMDLNWYYMIMLTVIMYGFKHTNLLDWFTDFCGKYSKYRYWFVSILVAIVFIIFRSLEGNVINASYISGVLRSIIFTVVFSNIFIDIPVHLIKGFGMFIDTKTN
jgi:hypothetical protein